MDKFAYFLPAGRHMHVIDLNTKIIPEQHSVFNLHPGKGKKFYETFSSGEMVFLDYPGMILRRGDSLASDDLAARLSMSLAVKKWFSRRQQGEPPPRDLEAYRDATRSIRLRTHVANINGLYFKAKRGDLVVCPGGTFRSPVLIGEIIDDFDGNHYATLPYYGDERLPARKVKWLSARRLRGTFSAPVLDMLQQRRALTLYSTQSAKMDIYREAYGSFVWFNTAYVRYLANKNTTDIRSLVPSIELLMYFSAMGTAHELGRLEEFLSIPFSKAANEFYNPTAYSNFGVQLTSKGFLSLDGATKVLPLLVSALLTTTTQLNAQEVPKEIRVINSLGGTDDDCTIQVDQRLREIMQVIHVDKFNKMCDTAKIKSGGVGLESHAQPTLSIQLSNGGRQGEADER